MRCPGCGREASGDVKYCEHCGHLLVEPTVEGSPIVYTQGSKKMPTALWLVIIGFIVIGIGGVFYVVGMSNAVDTSSDWWNDPMSDSSSFLEAFDIVLAAYVVMLIGAILLFVGLILLVIHE